MTKEQEKLLTEKFIRPMVKKMLKENISLNPNSISKSVASVLQTDNYRFKSHQAMIQEYLNSDVTSIDDLDTGDLNACADFVLDIVKALKKSQ